MALQSLPRGSLKLTSGPVVDILKCVAYPLLSRALSNASHSDSLHSAATLAKEDRQTASYRSSIDDPRLALCSPRGGISGDPAIHVCESPPGVGSAHDPREEPSFRSPSYSRRPTTDPLQIDTTLSAISPRSSFPADSISLGSPSVANPPIRWFSGSFVAGISRLREAQLFSRPFYGQQHLQHRQLHQQYQHIRQHQGSTFPAASSAFRESIPGVRRFSLAFPRGPSSSWSQNKAVNKTSFYDVTVEKYAAQPVTAMTMQHMMQFGEQIVKDPSYMLRQARFVHRELPIRLAKRLMDLQFLPYIVVTNPHIKQVYDSYRRALDLLVAFPEVRTMEDNEKFTELLALLVEEHTPLIGVLARGVRECSIRPLVGRELNLDSFLDNMLRSRISRRVIAEQHIALQEKRPGFIGVICTNMSVREVVEDAVEEATDMCARTFGCCPEFVLTGDLHTTFAYIPSHLHYMLFEILKNASRAILEHHTHLAEAENRALTPDQFPPVIVTVCSGANEVTIKVSDLGGGIPEKLQHKVWRYGYSSVEGDVNTTSSLRSAAGGPVDSQGTPMAGLGFGLPYSRLLAQYLGGNIEFVSIPGYGTDVYVRVRRVVDQTEAVEI